MNPLLEFASSLTRETKWYGDHNENDRFTVLKAGCLSMVYERGSLRSISIGNREVIRMIYSALRDREWLIIKPVISEEKFDIYPDSFRIRYHCLYRSGEINFSAVYTIDGNADNSLIFTLKGEAMDTFEKNRIGFCVLHPAEIYAEKSCTITHGNGDQETLKFPRFISPHQPFTDIKSMKWKIFSHFCTLEFYGDVFETEDQRNWTDSTFKTYCTPLRYPFPVKLAKGEKTNQKIKLKVEGDFKGRKNVSGQTIITLHPERIFPIPAIGIGRSTRPEPLSPGEIQTIKSLRPDHYRVDLYLFDRGWRLTANSATSEASRMECPIEFVLFFDENAEREYKEFIDWISVKKPAISLIIIYHKTQLSTLDSLTDLLAPLLKKALPGVRIGCGTNANFAQLNRRRPGSVHTDYICYSIHPQEHTSDNLTLVENLQAQGSTVESAKHFSKGRKIWISPVNIQRRFNANIENYEQPFSGVDPPPQVDSRLMSLFGACWTVGSLKYLCETEPKGITFYETVGERGVIQGDLPSRWPDEFKSHEGMIFPVFFALKYLLECKSFKIIKSQCSDPLEVESLVLLEGTNLKLLIVNFSSVIQQVTIRGCSGDFKVKQLNTENFASAVTDINWIENTFKTEVRQKEYLDLKPFSVSFIDGNIKV